MRFWVLAGVIAVGLVGCKKPQGRNEIPVIVPTTQSTTRPTADPSIAVTTRPTTLPGVQVQPPTQSELLIISNNVPETVVFPPAKVVMPDAPTRELVLSSKDPSRALRGGYEGNRYYFRFRLQGDQLTARNTTGVARVSHESSLRRDEPDGIFLGEREQFQPREAVFQFQTLGREMIVTVDGVFLVFERRDMGPSREVRVTGTLRAQIVKP